MRKLGGTPPRRDKHVTLAAISPPGVARGRFVGGHQSGLAGCKPPPLFTRGTSSCSAQGRGLGEPWGASPRPSAPTYLPTLNIRGDAEAIGQAQGARTGSSGEEGTGRQLGQPVGIIRGAEDRDGDNRGRRECGPGKGSQGRRREQNKREASQGEHEQEQGTAARGDEEHEP